MNTGIWIRIGRQPPSGLTPCCDCSFCISCAMRCLSLPYFFFSFWISGANSCILRMERTWLTNGLNKIARSVNTRNITASAHAMPLSGPRNGIAPNTVCQNPRIMTPGSR